MDKHCKGCVYHHNAGHPKTAKAVLKKYNDWCTRAGKTASKAIGECKQKGMRDEDTKRH